MDTVEYLREKGLLDENCKKFTIIKDENEFSLNDLLEEFSEKKGHDSYLRLYADFENYKKRTNKEKEDLVTNTKVKLLQSILDMENDLSFALKSQSDNSGINLIMSKLTNFLKSQGIEEIQTTEYDSELHEVITVIPGEEGKIIDVVSKGWTLGGKPFRYPKIILGKGE
jgi:molecular chaperone GrpE